MASILDEIHQTFGQSDNGGAPSQSGAGARPRSVEEFAAEVAPAAEAVGRRIGVDPAVLIGQWGLETGWGKSVIPGTNNLGNIKDFSGRGVEATDNMTGSRDGYRAYADYNAFGDDYASLLERRYKDALGSGGDAMRFGAALKAGGYAEDPAYVEKLASAADMVRGVSPRQTGGESANYTASNRDVLVDSSNMMEARRRQSASDASPISTSLGRGWEQMTDAVGNYVDLLAGDEEAIVDRLQHWQKYDAENPMPSASQRFMADWTDENYVGAMMNPAGLFGGMTEQLANSIPAMAGSIPGMLIGGAYGAGFGPLGVLVGAAAGGAAGSAPGSVAIETGARLPAMMAADGVDVSSPQAVSAWLNQNRDKVIEEGAKKGLTVAAFDGVMGGMGSAIVMKPAARFAQAESRIFAGMGVQAGDKAAMEAARKTPQYAAAIKPFAAELEVASSAANNAMRAFASFAAETAGEIGGEYYGEVAATGEGNWNEALLEGVMAGGQSAVTTGAQFVGGKAMAAIKPNSPLTNAANLAGQASQEAAAQGQVAPAQDQGQQDASAQPEQEPAAEVSEFDQRLSAAQSFVEDKAFLQALRGTEGFGKESVTELLSAYAKARNPNVDDLVRERALADIERFVETFNSRPNFTMPGATEAQGTDVVPAGRNEVGPARQPRAQDDGQTIDGEVVTRPAQIEGQGPQALPTEEALQAKRQADADYDQAYQDLVKAEQLGASDAELVQYRQALEEAAAQQEALSAQLEDVARRVEGAQQQEAESRRRALLDNILDDPNTVNPSARFAAELRRNGYADAAPSAAELDIIKRFEDAREALAQAENVEPAAPNQMPEDVVPERVEQAAPVRQKSPAEKIEEVKALVRAGWKPVTGRKLVSPSGKVRNLNPLEFAAAKEEYRKLKSEEESAKNAQTGTAQPTEDERLSAKRALYRLFSETGAPDDVVASQVMKVQDRANNLGKPMGVWISKSGAIGVLPIERGSPFVDGKQIATVYPETEPREEESPEGVSTEREHGANLNAQESAENAQTEQAQADAVASEFEHNGTRIYPVRIRVGDAVNTKWGVESAENRAKRDAGERHGFGDSLHDTPDDARAAADRERQDIQKRAEWQRQNDEAQAKIQAEEAARKADTINGFTTDKTPMQAGKIREALAKQYRFDGVVRTVRQQVEWLHANGGLEVSTFDEPKIKPMSRAQFNRATQREQDAHEKKMREAGTKTVYLVGGSDLGKIAYDYAKHLLAERADSDIQVVEGGSAYRTPQSQPEVDGIDASKGDAEVSVAGEASGKAEIKSDLDAAAHEAATSPLNDRPHPSDEQKSAGNYKVGKIRLHGMDISIENPRGSVRSGVAPDGTRWENRLAHHYGYIRGSEGRDGDHLDVFLTDGAESAKVAWVIDQKNEDGTFDEHKIVVGPATEQEARDAYMANYAEGWSGIGAITSMPMEAFKAWALDGKKKRKPLAYVAPAIIEPQIIEDNPPAETEALLAEAAELAGRTIEEARQRYREMVEKSGKDYADDVLQRTVDGRRKAQEPAKPDSAPSSVEEFAQIEESRAALVIQSVGGAPEQIKEMLDAAGIKSILRKTGVSIPKKDNWDRARQIIPVRVERHSLGGLHPRYADIDVRVFDSGAAAVYGVNFGHMGRAEKDTATAIENYRNSFAGVNPDATMETAWAQIIALQEDLRAKVDAKNPDLGAIYDASVALRQAVVKEIESRLDAGEMPVIKKGQLVYAVHPAVDGKNAIQVTRYNETGALGDTRYSSVDSAVKDGDFSTGRFLSAEEAKTVMAESAKAEGEYQRRKMDASALEEVAERVAEDAPAAHVEDGDAEPATQAVVAEAVQKSADNTPRDLKEAKRFLMGKIDEAIKSAPTEKKDGAGGFIVFDVPGDGRFKVVNTKDRLAAFKKQVNASVGFSENSARQDGFGGRFNPEMSDKSRTGVREMLDDGDLTAALAYAEAIGKPMAFSVARKGDAKPAAYYDAEEREQSGVRAIVGREWTKSQSWAAIDPASGTVIAQGKNKAEVTKRLNDALASPTVAAKIKQEISAKSAMPQSALSAQWLEWAEAEQDRLDVERAKDAERERRTYSAPTSQTDSEGWGRRIAEGGLSVHTKRIDLESGESAVAILRGIGGGGYSGEILVAGSTTERFGNGFGKSMDLAEAKEYAEGALSNAKTADVDYKGFERKPIGNGAFELRDGNMTVRVEPQGDGKYQASFRGAKSSPHLHGEQGAVDWADAYRVDGKKAQQPSRYKGPADVSSVAGQKELASRAGTIAALKGMNAQLRAIAPHEAWADANIEQSDNLDDLRTRISEALVKAQRAQDSGTVDATQSNDAELRHRLNEASGADLRSVMDALHLDGKRMAQAERVEALMREDAQAVSDALDDVQKDGEPAAADVPAEPPHYADLRDRARAYWAETVVPAVREYLDAFSAFGAGRLERNRAKPEGMSAREWLESFWRKESEWRDGRKVSETGVQTLSRKDLWPTEDGSGERLRKSMLAAIKALRGAPMTTSDMLAEAFMESSAAPAANQPALTGPRRNPAQVSAFTPYLAGDIVTIDGQDWQVQQDMGGWYLTSTGNWRGMHPTIQRIKAMNDLIREVEQASRDGQESAQDAAESQPEQGVETDISADKSADEAAVKESLTAQSDAISPDAATKQMEWRDGGQRDGERRHTLIFKESAGDINGITVATLRKYGKGKWVLDDADMDGDIESFDGLREAKKAGLARALKYLEREGYVEKADATAETVAQKAEPDAAEGSATEQQGQDGALEDFGEKLGGARKDLQRAMDREFSDEELATLPLSKIWPAEEIDKIDSKVVAAFAFAARSEIPPKPRKKYKLASWIGKVKSLRSIVSEISGTEDTAAKILDRLKGWRVIPHFGAKVALLNAIERDNWKRIGSVAEHPDAYTYTDGKQVGAPYVSVDVDGNYEAFRGAKSVADVVEKVEALLGAEQKSKRMQFDVRGSGNSFFINKKGDREYRRLKTFSTAKEAFEYIKNDYDALVQAWEDVKERDNVSKRDVRGEDNRPRTGKDWRNGEDVTPEQFSDVFGFRGVEFGNWVGQGDGDKGRQGMLNQAFDALSDLADILGIPSRAVSLNGTLGLAFGSRGKGRASAHFEPSRVVINLTKTRGAGSLAHEWFHALDNYFSRQREGEVAISSKSLNAQEAYRTQNFITYRPEPMYVRADGNTSSRLTKAKLQRYREQAPGSKYYDESAWRIDPSHPEGVRQQVERAFAELVETLDASPMAQRSKGLDKEPDGYWSRIIERGARAFENYIISKMAQGGYDNDYLANVRSIEDFPRSSDRYPYLLPDEIAPVEEAFDNLFSTIESKETDQGVALFRFDSEETDGGIGVSRVEADAIVRDFVAAFPGSPKIEVVDSFDQLPISVQADARSQGAQPGSTKGAYLHGRKSAFVVVGNHTNRADLEATLFHEVLGHAGVRKMFGSEFVQEQNKLFMALGGIDGLTKIMRERGLDGHFDRYVENLIAANKENPARWTEDKVRFILTEEVFAHVAEQQKSKPGLRDRFMALIGMIRNLLRKTGLVKLAELGETDLLFMLNRARKTMKKGDASIVRAGVSVAQGQIRDADGSLIADESDKEYSALRTAAEVLGLVESQREATVFRIDDEAETIDVDGVERPRLNSEGRSIHPTAEGVRNFWRWFGDSKVVDSEGRPLVMYHGTGATEIAEFLPEGGVDGEWQSALDHFRSAKSKNDKYGYINFRSGSFFSPDPSYAGNYTGESSGVIYPVYLRVENPVFYDMSRKNPASGVDAGRTPDGLVLYDGEVSKIKEVAVIDPVQIKSAVGNKGAFDPSDASIMRQRIDNSNIRNAVFTALAKFDDSFQQPRATQKTLDAIAKEIDPGFRVVEKPSGFAKLKTKGRAVRAWEIFPRDQETRSGLIFEDARGRVWVDVQRLIPGVDQGNKIYGIVAGYAHNNGKVFIGDPAGLSETGFFRRLENMISSALKYGSTDHIYPHAAQIDPEGYYEAEGEPEKAKRLKGLGLDWKEGDFSHNLTQMLEASYNGAVRFAPELKDIVYDFNSRQFVDVSSGERRSKREFEDLSSGIRARSSKGHRGGSTTYARAAIYNSLVREGSREGRRNLLAQISDQLSGRGLDFELRKIFYQRNAGEKKGGLSADAFRAALVERFGEDGVSRLEELGLLNIASPDGQDSSSPAWYDTNSKQAYFVPEFMADAKAAVGAVLHEIGEHHGLESFLGPRAWRTLKARIASLHKEGGNDVQAAWDGVLDTYPEFAGMSRSALIESDRFMHEVIAKIGESAAGRKSSLWRDVLMAVNRFLLKMGLGRQINKNELADLVAGSLARVMRGEGGDGPKGRPADSAGESESVLKSIQPSARAVTANRLQRFVSEFRRGKMPAEFNQVLGDTPNVLRAVGAPPLPLEISAGALSHIVSDRHAHEITLDMVAEAIDGLYDPDVVFASKQHKGSLVALTSVNDRRGNPVVVALHMGKVAGRLRVNKIASAYGKESPASVFEKWAKDGLLLYAHKERSLEAPTTSRLYLPSVVQVAQDSGKKFITDSDVVKEFGRMFARQGEAGQESIGQGAMRQRAFSLHDYMQSPEAKRSLRERIGDAIAAAFDGSTARTFNLWERTVGTQYGKSRKDGHFRRVYESAHAFVDDVSRFANEAADKARDILPHMDGLKDIAEGLNMRKAWSDAKDYEAVASAIFDGTLEGKQFSEKELEERFGLNEKQREVYRQFRAAVDASLESLAASEMARAARAAKLEVADSAMSMEESEAFYTDQVQARIDAAREAIEDMLMRHDRELEVHDEIAQEFPRKEAFKDARKTLVNRQSAELEEAKELVDSLTELRDSFTDKADKIRELSNEGYAPLMRYGQYVVDVVRLDEDGAVAMTEEGEPDRPFFGMFETEAEAKEAAKILADEYPGYTVSRGVLSELANQQFKGLTPEVAELFARLLGTSENEAFQAYLKQAVANRSAMKRLIHRKGMAGFSQDVPRVLASFITSNARLTSGNWHFGEMSAAIADIPKSKGDVQDEAIKLAQYIQNPQEEAAGIRGFMFFNFLGGSVAAAMVNLTQTASTTFPFLAQWGAKDAAKAITKAMSRSARVMKDGKFDSIVDASLLEALVRASEEGIIDPQEIHLLMAEASGSDGLTGAVSKAVGKINKGAEVPVTRVGRAFMQAWGSMFGAAEKYNRHVAFMAAWDMAPAGVDRYSFAKDAVVATQFDYTKSSRPNWGRGPIGATLFTFRTFMVSYIEFLGRLPSRERAIAVAVLMLLSGMSGLPGADDLDDVIDTIGQKMGYNWNNAASRHAWLVKTLGVDGTNMLEHGLSSIIPLDVSARLGMGNLFPMTGLFKKSNEDKGREAAEVFGAPGAFAKNLVEVIDRIGTGRPVMEATLPALPKAVSDAYKAIDMLQTGAYRDGRGRKVVDVTAADAFIKAIGFQPNRVAEPRRVEWMLAQSSAMFRTARDEIHDLWARGVAERDKDKIDSAREAMVSWNRKNPKERISINPASIRNRVRAMRLTSAERLVKATPKDMRGMLSAELEAR